MSVPDPTQLAKQFTSPGQVIGFMVDLMKAVNVTTAQKKVLVDALAAGIANATDSEPSALADVADPLLMGDAAAEALVRGLGDRFTAETRR